MNGKKAVGIVGSVLIGTPALRFNTLPLLPYFHQLLKLTESHTKICSQCKILPDHLNKCATQRDLNTVKQKQQHRQIEF